MFDDELYEVTRNEFKGFINQIKPDCFDHVILDYEGYKEIKIISTDRKRHFASVKTFPNDEEMHYFVYEMPNDDERCEAKPVKTITLNTKEEVQTFFEALHKIQKGELKND